MITSFLELAIDALLERIDEVEPTEVTSDALETTAEIETTPFEFDMEFDFEYDYEKTGIA